MYIYAYGARGRTSFVLTPNERWILGDNRVTTGVLMVFNDQRYFSSSVDHFSILANGTELAVARAGEKITIALAPYHQYKIEVFGVNKKKERTRNPFLTRSVVVYPGRVTPLKIAGG